MPAQTTNLILLEDLEDVGRTTELAREPGAEAYVFTSGSRRWRRRRTATKSANRRCS